MLIYLVLLDITDIDLTQNFAPSIYEQKVGSCGNKAGPTSTTQQNHPQLGGLMIVASPRRTGSRHVQRAPGPSFPSCGSHIPPHLPCFQCSNSLGLAGSLSLLFLYRFGGPSLSGCCRSGSRPHLLRKVK